MKRRGFLARVLAALGAGAVVSVGGHVMPLDGLVGRLHRMIERDRAWGLEVNFFHTNGATMEGLWKEIAVWPMAFAGGYTAFMFEGVEWCRCEGMEDGEILVSDVGIMQQEVPRWKPVRVGSESYVVDERLAKLWGVPLGEEF